LSFKFGIISYLVKHPFKSFGESNTHFLTVLDSLIGMRNKYAHYGFINKSPRHHTTTPPLRLNKLSHTTRATKTDFVFLNEKDLKEFYGDCFAVKKCLKELWNLIVESNKKRSNI